MNWYKQAKQEWARWQIVEMLEKAFKLPPEGMMKTHPRGPFELEIGPKAMDNPKCMDFMNAARDIKAHMCIGMHFPDERSPEQDGTIVANGTISSKNEGELLGDTTFVNSWMLSELNQVPFDIVNTVYAIIDSPDDGDEEEEIEFDPSPLDPELVPVSATSSLKILSMNWYHNHILLSLIKQADVQSLVPTLQGWGEARGKSKEEIDDAIQQLLGIEQQQIDSGKPSNDNWLRGSFGEILFPKVQQPQVPQVSQVPQQLSEEDRQQQNLINKAKGINQEYWKWVLQVMQSENRVDFNQSIFDYFKGNKIDPLNNPSLSYAQAEAASEAHHQQYSKEQEKLQYKTPVTAGEPIGDMYMVEVNADDEVAEGKNMGNCIGDLCRVSESNKIYSLRDSNNNPHASIQIENGIVGQIRGKGNTSPILEYSEYIVEWLLKYPEINLGNLDNIPVSEDSFTKLESRLAPESLLSMSSSLGSMKFVQKAIENGATDFDEAMNSAARNGHIKIVKLMIDNGATNFNWAMNYAAENGHIDIVNLMIDKGAIDFNEAMNHAALGGHIDIVNLMIENGAINFNEAMYSAAENGHIDIVNLMIDKGATEFNSAMNYAALGGHIDIVNLMIENGATDFNSAMDYAALGGHIDIVKRMIENGATDFFNEAMYSAAENGHIDIVNLMIDKGATEFDRAMYSAAENGHIKIVKLMIDKGATDFNSAMRSAARMGHDDIVNLLQSAINESPS